MTKTFEEEAKEKILNSSRLYIAHEGAHADVDKGGGMALKIMDVVYIFPWLEFARNWHSDEEFQELFDKFSNLNDNYEKEVIRSSKLEDQNIGLKFQLQQQPLPVVPECVAGIIKKYKGRQSVYGVLKTITRNRKTDIYEWVFSEGNQNIFALAFITGKYEVEKPQLFYLKHIDMSKADKECDWYLITDCVKLCHEWVGKNLKPKDDDFKFTQQEIDSMQTGSYEQIEVTE